MKAPIKNTAEALFQIQRLGGVETMLLFSDCEPSF